MLITELCPRCDVDVVMPARVWTLETQIRCDIRVRTAWHQVEALVTIIVDPVWVWFNLNWVWFQGHF